jgi:hypothetical protein
MKAWTSVPSRGLRGYLMTIRPQNLQRARSCAVGAVLLTASVLATSAADKFIQDTTVTIVAAHGGMDTGNPGTACMQFATAPLAACTGGWVSIPNNNKQLVATALMAKATGARVTLYYDDTASSQHCPGLAFTPCAAISLLVK